MRLVEILKKKDGNLKGTVKRLAFLNLILAVTALFKDVLMAAYMGTTGEADALLLAYSITDIVGNNMFGAAIGTSCIPAFSSVYMKNGKREFQRSIAIVSVYVTAASSILLAALFIFREEIIGMLGRNFSGSIHLMFLELFVIMLPTIILYPAAAVGSSAMQVSGRFTVPAAAPIIFNSIYLIPLFLGYILKIPINIGVYFTAVSISTGVLAMVLMIWFPLFKHNIRFSILPSVRHLLKPAHMDRDVLKRILDVFIPYLLILISTQGVLYIERYISTGMGEGLVAGLNYAYRLSQFPVWVFTAAIGTVVYPSIAKYMEEGDYERLRKVISRAIFAVLLITIPMSLFLMIFRVPVISVLFMRGAFDYNSLKITSDILFGYCISIGGQSVAAICLKALLSAGKMKKALAAYAVSFIVNVCLDFYLTPIIGIKGIGYGAAAGAILNGILTYLAVRVGFKTKIKPDKAAIVGIVSANMLMVLASVILINLWYGSVCSEGFILKAGFVMLSVLVCTAIYGSITYMSCFKRWGGIGNE